MQLNPDLVALAESLMSSGLSSDLGEDHTPDDIPEPGVEEVTIAELLADDPVALALLDTTLPRVEGRPIRCA